MTESQLRKEIVDQAKSWLGRKEADGTHRVIIDVYNSIYPLPRGYRMTYSDPWCATFVSACAQVWGLTKIVFPECACDPMIKLYQTAGRWMEDDDYVPSPGDIIFYDWNDDGKGDNTGSSDHVGIVTGVDGNRIMIIEGNCDDSVCYQYRRINDRYIRGYGLPDFASLAEEEPSEDDPPAEPAAQEDCSVTLPVLQIGACNGYVSALQALLIARGYSVGPDGADGDFGNNTRLALIKFQRRKGLDQDGVAGPITWDALLRG